MFKFPKIVSNVVIYLRNSLAWCDCVLILCFQHTKNFPTAAVALQGLCKEAQLSVLVTTKSRMESHFIDGFTRGGTFKGHCRQ